MISHENILVHHIPCGYACMIIGSTGKNFKGPVVYRGDNVVNVMLYNFLKSEKEMRGTLKSNKKMVFTNEDKENFLDATTCHICGGELFKKLIRDHCHITWKYRGASYPSCNLNYKLRN